MNRNFNRILFLSIIITFLLFISPAWSATISGTVKMEGKKDKSGVLVTIQGKNLSSITDKDGKYSIPNVPPGSYTLIASKPGYIVGVYSDVVVSSGTVVVDLQLSPGDLKIDNQINLLDMLALASVWQAKEGDVNWDSMMDIYEDGRIDEKDKELLLSNWRKGNPNIKLGSLAVSSEPEGAIISINGADTGKPTPYEFRGMVTGEYTITLKLEGYTPVEQKVRIEEGITQILPTIILDNQPPEFVNWTRDPANLTEDTKGRLRITVQTIDKGGSGLSEKAPQFDYHIGADTKYTGYKDMKQDGDLWYYDIPEPVEGWDAYRGKYIYYKAKAEDMAGNVGESPEQQELIDDINDSPTVRIANTFSTWEKGLLTIVAEAEDTDGTISSVKFEYSFDNANWTQIGSPLTKPPYSVAWDTKTVIREVAKNVWVRAIATDDDASSATYSIATSFAIDNQPPTTVHDYDGLWHNKDFIISLKASDGTGIGVAGISYRLNDGTKQEIPINAEASAQVVITKEDMANVLEYWSVDKLGNEEQHRTLSNIKLDKTAPVLRDWRQDPPDLTEDTVGRFRVSAQVTDEVSGLTGKIPQFDYHIGSETQYTGFQNMTSEDGRVWYFDIPEPAESWNAYRGKYIYYKVRSEDVAGNVGESVERRELIDNINDPPTVKIESTFEAWERGLLTIVASASDTDGTIAGVQFEYSFDKVDWKPIGSTVATAPYSIGWDTTTSIPQAQTVWIRAVALDNDSAPATHTYPSGIGIDNQPPITSDDYDGLWHREDFFIKLSASDGKGVGISESNIRYRLNKGDEKNVLSDGQPLITDEGTNQLEYWSIDNLGNVEARHTIQNIKLDKTPPEFADWVHDPTDLTEDSKGNLRVSVRVTDRGGSGLTGKVPQFSYRIGTDAGYTEYTNMAKGEAIDVWYYDIPEPPETWDGVGGKYIYYKARVEDVAGNIAESPERQELIDSINDPPMVRIVTTFSSWEKDSIKIQAEASDIDGTIADVRAEYSFDKVNWKPIGTMSAPSPYSITWDTKAEIPEVSQTVWVKAIATDNEGSSVEHVIPNSFKVDNQPPVTSHDYDGLWRNKEFVINLTATDKNGIGVSSIAYRLNNADKQEVPTDGRAAVPVNITKEGANTLEYWSIDKLGNEETHKVLTNINLDKTAPIFSNWEQDPANLTEDTTGRFQVSVHVTDEISGLTGKTPQIDYHIGTDTQYDGYENMKIKSGNEWYFDIAEPAESWNAYRGKYVYYKVKCEDVAGNIAESTERQELIDSINDPPVVKLTSAFKDWETKQITISAEASDPDGSTPAVQFEYSTDATNWVSVGEAIFAPPYSTVWDTKSDIPEVAKSVQVRASAVDADDSSVVVKSTASKKFGVDNQPPVSGDWTKSPENLTEDTVEPFRVSVSFNDGEGSGVKKVELSYRIGTKVVRDFREMKQESANLWYYEIVESGGWDKYRGETLYYKARATDAVGNVSPETKEQQELIDDINDPPRGSITSTYKTWEGKVLTIQADAIDDDGQITGVQFQYSQDNIKWTSIGSAITRAPYITIWDTSQIDLDPDVWLKAVITDDDNATAEALIAKSFGIDNKPPAFDNWKLTPANLTESSTESFFLIEVAITDQGSGLDDSKVQLYYKIEDMNWTVRNMVRGTGNTWFYEIPRPLGGWRSYAGQNIYYKVKADDIVGNSAESEERKELVDPTTGAISGTITPRESWRGAKVVAQKDGKTVAESTVSQIDGSYSMTGLEPSLYNLIITAVGFGTDSSRTNIEVKVGQTTTVPNVELYTYAVEKITRLQGGKVEFKDSDLKDYTLIVESNALLQDSKVVLGFSGNEPTSVPNPKVHLLGRAIGVGFEGKDIARPLKLVMPRPDGITDGKSIMTFIYDGKDYRFVNRNEIAVNDTTITINIDPQDVKNFSDPNHKFDKTLSRTTDTAFYVLITRFDEPQISLFDLGILEPQLTLGRVSGYAQPSISAASRKIALILHGITSKPEDLANLINDLKSLKPTGSGTPYYDHVLVFNYEAGKSITSNSLTLMTELTSVLPTGFDGKIDVIAHDMGGLVARQAIINGGDAYIGSLVMLGTPNGGVNEPLLKAGFANFLKNTQADPAWTIYRDGWQEMSENSQYLMALNNQPGRKVNTHYYAIAASDPYAVSDADNNDGLVYLRNVDYSNNTNFPSVEQALTELFEKVTVAQPTTEGKGFMSGTRHFAMIDSSEIRGKIATYLRGKSENIKFVESDIDLIPGSRIDEFKVVLKNVGTETVYGVTAKLSTQSPYIRKNSGEQGIEKDSATFGDIPKDGTKTGAFSFNVSQNATEAIGQQITFELVIRNSIDNSISIERFTAPIGGNLVQIAVDTITGEKAVKVDVQKDTARPENDGDSAIEPGETMKIDIALQNRSSTTFSVKATLKTDDPRVKGLSGTTEVDMAKDGITVDYGTLSGKATSLSKSFQYVKVNTNFTPLGDNVKFTLEMKSGTNLIGKDEFSVKIGADIVLDRVVVDRRLKPGGGPEDIDVYIKNITSKDISNVQVRITPDSGEVDIAEDRVSINLLRALQTQMITFETEISDNTFAGYVTFTLEIRVSGVIINVDSFRHYFGMRTHYIANWITDDGEGTAGDKIAEPGEPISLQIARRNPTNEIAEDVEVTLDTTDAAIIKPLSEDKGDYRDIPANGTAGSRYPYEFTIASASSTVFTDDPDFEFKGHTATFTLYVEENGEDMGTENFTLRIGGVIRYLPPAGYDKLLANISDAIALDPNNNNGNGIPEPGETIELTVTLINITSTYVSNVRARLRTDERDVDIDNDEITFGTMGYSGSKRTGKYQIKIDKDFEGNRIEFKLYIKGRIGDVDKDLGMDTFMIPVKNVQ